MFCFKCGTEISDEARFCPNCGTQMPFNNNGEFSQQPQSSEQSQSFEQTQPLEQTQSFEQPQSPEQSEFVQQPQYFQQPQPFAVEPFESNEGKDKIQVLEDRIIIKSRGPFSTTLKYEIPFEEIGSIERINNSLILEIKYLCGRYFKSCRFNAHDRKTSQKILTICKYFAELNDYDMPEDSAKTETQQVVVVAENKEEKKKPLSKRQRIKENKRNGIACCPKCGSTSLASGKQGFGIGKAVLGANLISNPIGLVAGNIHSKRVDVTCLNCGHRWKV